MFFSVKYSHESDEKDIELPPKKYLKINEDQDDKSIIENSNKPFLMAIFKTPDNLDEHIIILYPLLSGISNVRFYLSEDGKEAHFTYNWPTPLYNISSIFKKDSKDITKIMALQEQLLKHRNTINDIPKDKLTIKLPFPVQTNTAEHIITGYEDKDGSRIMRIELPGMKKNYAQLHQEIKFGK